MPKIKNLTNSPIEIQSTEGMKVIPSFASLEGEFDPEYLNLLKLCGSVSVVDANEVEEELQAPIPAPVTIQEEQQQDDDGDEDEQQEAPKAPLSLREEYAAMMGKPAPKAWNDKKLAAEVKKLKEN